MSEAYSYGGQYGQSEQEEPTRLPMNIESEQALLGALLLNNDAYDRVSDFLRAEHFFEPLHARLYQTITDMIAQGRTASPVTISSYFSGDEALTEVGGGQYLAKLAVSATTILNIQEYGRGIEENAQKRGIIQTAETMLERAYGSDFTDTPKQQIEDAEAALYAISSDQAGAREANIIETYEAVLVDADLAKRSGGSTAISWGLPTLDALLGKLLAGQVIYIGGATSSGKTSLAMSAAERIAQAFECRTDGTRLSGARVGVFSLEMSKKDLAQRFLSQRAFVEVEKIVNGSFSDEERARMVEARQYFDDLPLWIDDTGSLKVSQLRSRIRRMQRRHGIDVAFVDHLRFLKADQDKRAEHENISSITSTLKAIAKELEIPIVCLMHLTKEHTKRDDHRPNLGDAYGSSAIEQDADVVAMVHREEYWLERNEPGAKAKTEERVDWDAELMKWRGLAEIILCKRRNGKGAGIRQIRFTGKYALFSELRDVDPLTLEPGYQEGLEL